MGNELRHQVKLLQPQLELYCEIEHAQHGLTRIYSSHALPMTFLMRLQRATAQSRLYNLFQQIQNYESHCLITLYGFRIEREEGCGGCETEDQTLQYWEFLNYTLQDHLRDRIRRGVAFTHHEIWHIFQIALSAAEMLQRVGLIWQVHPAYILITPEGKVKADWSHLQANNAHLQYYQAFNGQRRGGYTWFSPEEQWLLKQKERSSHLNLQKSNVYKLGLLLLSLAALIEEPKLGQQTWNKITKYPKPIPYLIDRCLHPDPSKRPSLIELNEDYEQYFSSSYQLLINQGSEEDLQDLQMQAQMIAESKKRGHKFNKKQASRHSLSSFSNRIQGQHIYTQSYSETFDQRLASLRDYRRNLAMTRGRQS